MDSEQWSVNRKDNSVRPTGKRDSLTLTTVHYPLPTLKICCGPRCGAEPGHRLIYAAVEQVATDAGLVAVPTMCRSACSGGVTVILPNGTVKKVSDVSAAKTVLDSVPESSDHQ